MGTAADSTCQYAAPASPAVAFKLASKSVRNSLQREYNVNLRLFGIRPCSNGIDRQLSVRGGEFAGHRRGAGRRKASIACWAACSLTLTQHPITGEEPRCGSSALVQLLKQNAAGPCCRCVGQNEAHPTLTHKLVSTCVNTAPSPPTPPPPSPDSRALFGCSHAHLDNVTGLTDSFALRQ